MIVTVIVARLKRVRRSAMDCGGVGSNLYR